MDGVERAKRKVVGVKQCRARDGGWNEALV
jgi:hypothetical protein